MASHPFVTLYLAPEKSPDQQYPALQILGYFETAKEADDYKAAVTSQVSGRNVQILDRYSGTFVHESVKTNKVT
jgi:hypothetical protein